jgi:hypothetical protein
MYMMNIFLRIIGLLFRRKYTWIIYEMWDSPGSVCILGCYFNHDKACDQLYKLRGMNPDKRYGLQITHIC